jgi:hypothetical protein
MKVYAIDQAWIHEWDHPNSFSFLRLINLKIGKFDQKYSRDFFREIFSNYSSNQPIIESWRNPKIEEFKYKNYPFPDITRIAGEPTVHLFSQIALEKISLKIKNDGEILPFQGQKLSYSWFRILRDLNVLKTDSAMGFTANPEYIPYLEKYDFHTDPLENIYLFHIVNHPGTFATDLFVDLVKQHDFKGLDFLLIWDSENFDYVDERFKPEVWAEIKKRHANR